MFRVKDAQEKTTQFLKVGGLGVTKSTATDKKNDGNLVIYIFKLTDTSILPHNKAHLNRNIVQDYHEAALPLRHGV